MITAFTVKNFKAIGEEPVRIELKPITLLFGANSAGKSSIIHALNYAYSVFIDHNLNAEYNDHSDSSLNLGRFDRFVHCHSKNRSIILRFDLDFQSAIDIPENILINMSEELAFTLGEGQRYAIYQEFEPRKILSYVKTAYVEVEISWSHVRNNPYVSRYETGLDNERIATIHTDDNSNKTMVRYFNKAHAAFKEFLGEHKFGGSLLDKGIEKNELESVFIRFYEGIVEKNEFDLNWLVSYESTTSLSDNNINLELIDQEDALPDFTKRLNLEPNIWCNQESLIDRGFLSSNHDYNRYQAFESLTVTFENFLTAVLVPPGNKVANWLRNTRYLGPLREIPSRYFLGEISGNFNNSRWRWEKGLGAWDVLYRIGQIQSDQSEESHLNLKEHGDRLLHIINKWLSNEQLLNTGYKVFIERYREISSVFFKDFDENKSQKNLFELFKKIFNEPEIIRIWLHDISRDINLKPHEIGTGISQVLPVVVAAIGTDASLVAIEQPELHIHPALQVRLGDLFIKEIHKKTFLIETHSEHLILRLMRRMRETYLHKNTGLPPVTPANISVLYVEPDGPRSIVREMPLNELGELIKSWPGGFFEEGLREQFGDA